jgi:hypothetical protein
MKYPFIIALFFSFTLGIAQIQNPNEESSTRIFIEKAQFTRINKDWSTIAEFKSGIGEYVNFYPIEVIDLKTGTKIKALQLDMYIKEPRIEITAWVGMDEIEEFINFVQNHVVPNFDLKFKEKSSEFVFKAKEMTLSYFIYEKDRKISIKLNNYNHDNDGIWSYTFWTETQVEKIPRLLEVLKKIKS